MQQREPRSSVDLRHRRRRFDVRTSGQAGEATVACGRGGATFRRVDASVGDLAIWSKVRVVSANDPDVAMHCCENGPQTTGSARVNVTEEVRAHNRVAFELEPSSPHPLHDASVGVREVASALVMSSNPGRRTGAAVEFYLDRHPCYESQLTTPIGAVFARWSDALVDPPTHLATSRPVPSRVSQCHRCSTTLSPRSWRLDPGMLFRVSRLRRRAGTLQPHRDM